MKSLSLRQTDRVPEAAPPVIELPSISFDDELEAIFSVISSSLAMENEANSANQSHDQENKARLTEQLGNYISLYMMQQELG